MSGVIKYTGDISKIRYKFNLHKYSGETVKQSNRTTRTHTLRVLSMTQNSQIQDGGKTYRLKTRILGTRDY